LEGEVSYAIACAQMRRRRLVCRLVLVCYGSPCMRAVSENEQQTQDAAVWIASVLDACGTNKKVSYRKQIEYQHLCHKNFWLQYMGPSSFITVQNLAILFLIPCARMYEFPKIWGRLGWRAWLTPRNTPLLTCYLAKFGRSRSHSAT